MHPPFASGDIVPPLPPNVPRTKPNRFARALGRAVLRLGGWRVAGAFPDLPKVVLIGAPHSSNWDGVWGLAAKLALGLDVRILGKHQLFWGPLAPLMRALGVVAVNRAAARGVVEQIAARFGESERFWIGIAPEGTRKPVERWKTGFWKIAREAGVPVLPVYFHYPDRVIGIGAPFETGGDLEHDLARLRAWYRPWQGKHHGTP